jgi:YVTN family beta-propeller protein
MNTIKFLLFSLLAACAQPAEELIQRAETGADPPPGGVVTAVIPIPGIPRELTAAYGSIWVTDGPGEAVTRIDPATNTVIATIPTGRPVGYIAAGGGAVFVASSLTDTLLRIDPATNSIVATFSSGGLMPAGMRVADGYLWVANHHGDPTGSVAKIDLATNQVLALIPLGAAQLTSGPASIEATQGAIWVGVPNLSVVARIDTATAAVTDLIPMRSACGGLAAIDDSLFVGGGGNDCAPGITRVDVASRQAIERIVTGGFVGGVAAGDGSVWGGAFASGFLVRLDAATSEVTGMLKLRGSPVNVAYGAGAVWVTDEDAHTVTRVQPL